VAKIHERSLGKSLCEWTSVCAIGTHLMDHDPTLRHRLQVDCMKRDQFLIDNIHRSCFKRSAHLPPNKELTVCILMYICWSKSCSCGILSYSQGCFKKEFKEVLCNSWYMSWAVHCHLLIFNLFICFCFSHIMKS